MSRPDDLYTNTVEDAEQFERYHTDYFPEDDYDPEWEDSYDYADIDWDDIMDLPIDDDGSSIGFPNGCNCSDPRCPCSGSKYGAP